MEKVEESRIEAGEDLKRELSTLDLIIFGQILDTQKSYPESVKQLITESLERAEEIADYSLMEHQMSIGEAYLESPFRFSREYQSFRKLIR